MSEKILVPELGESITEASIARWIKSKGETVNADEPIVELETDKVNLEVPSPVNGVISEKIKGSKGFGYDPIFIPNKYKVTFGQMNLSKKMKIDHRSIAFKKLKKKLKSYKFFI